MVPKSKKYLISISAGRHGYAATLKEAKKVGQKIAELTERNDKKWNVSYITVVIWINFAGGYYEDTGWHLVVPVKGTGAKRATTVNEIKRKFSVKPYEWFKTKNKKNT